MRSMSIFTRLAAAAVTLSLAGCSASATRWEQPQGAPSSAPASAAAPSGVTGPVHKPYGIPDFPPAPVAEPISLPAGDKVPYLSRIPTTQKVAFLTIDDGYVKLPEAHQLIAAAGVPVTLFLTTDAIRDDPDYFKPLIDAGAVVEAHTITHTELRGKSYAFQRKEICGSADKLAGWYQRRPVLFRPPFGTKDDTTLRAAHDCGMRAAFMWKETVDKGKVRYQEERKIKPGDIILMHFRPAFKADFLAALKAIHRAGLTPALLEDYVTAPGGASSR
jgi:peptidoglycan/xylan/chitin deacetylase (PgdA/CDA1 family)